MKGKEHHTTRFKALSLLPKAKIRLSGKEQNLSGRQEGENMATEGKRLSKKQKWGYRLAEKVPIKNIRIDEANVRMVDFNPDKNTSDAELIRSIQRLGIIHPPVATQAKEGEVFLVFDGGRRLEAAKRLKIDAIDLIVKNLDTEAFKTAASAVGTLHHRGLNFLEKANVAKSMLKLYKSETIVGRELGVSVKTVNEWLAFLKAPPIVIKMVVNGEMDGKSAVANFVRQGITTDEKAREIISKIKGKSQAKAREIIKNVKRVGATIGLDLYAKLKAKAEKRQGKDKKGKISEAVKEAIEDYVKA